MIALGRREQGNDALNRRGGGASFGALDEGLEVFRMVKGDQRVLDGDPTVLAELAEGAGNGFAGGAGHGGHLLVGEKQRESETEARGHSFGQSDPAGILKGEAVLLADALDSAHLRFLVAAQEAEEPVALDGTELGVGQGLGGDLVNAVGEHRIEPEHRARTGDANDHLAVFKTAGSQFEIAGANEIEAAGILALVEEGGLRGKGDGAGRQFKIGKNRAAKRAEPAGTAIGSGSAAGGCLSWHRLLPPGSDCLVLDVFDHCAPSDPDQKQPLSPISSRRLAAARSSFQGEKHSGPPE